MMDLQLRAAKLIDAAPIADIYNHYIRDTVVTFEEEPLPAEAMAGRMATLQAASLPWLVAESQGRIVGYAYAGRFKERSAYRHTVETTVYLDPVSTGQGIGKLLYTRLLDALQIQGMHAAIGIIALPNAPSVALHEHLGFRHVGTFREVGFKFNRWVDVGYWQTSL